MSIIHLEHLSKTYTYTKRQPTLGAALRSVFRPKRETVEAVHDLSFDIEKGELVGFLGPNGAGKTTTLKMLSGILYPTSGEASVMGFTPWQRKREFQKRFAIVMGQKNQLWWDLPAMETFLLYKELYDISDIDFQSRVHQFGELLDVTELFDRPVKQLSLGQRMKCELIAALLHQPEVLFLDEPTIGLDVISQEHIRTFIKTYNREQQTTILLTSHYMEDIEQLCDRVILIDAGAKLFDGSIKQLVERYAPYKLLTVTFTEDIEEHRLKKFGEIISAKPRRVVVRAANHQARHIAASILSTFPVDDLLIDQPGIEEVTKQLFQKH